MDLRLAEALNSQKAFELQLSEGEAQAAQEMERTEEFTEQFTARSAEPPMELAGTVRGYGLEP